jgi:hypothetical protein
VLAPGRRGCGRPQEVIVRTLVRLGSLLALAFLIHPRVSSAGALEARYAHVVLRFGQSDTSAASPGGSPDQRLRALAFEARWQAATMVLLRSLELCLQQGLKPEGHAMMQSMALPTPTLLVPVQPGEAVRSPSELLRTYRVPRLRTAEIPRGSEAFAACIESVGTYGNRALELTCKPAAPEASLREAITGLDRAFKRTERASIGLRLRLGPVTDSTGWATQVQGESPIEQWRVADSLERVLLIEAGARPAEVASYAEWIVRGSLPLACTECTAPGFWTAAGEVLRAYQRYGDRMLDAAGSDSRLYQAQRWDARGSSADENVVECFDAMGRRVWTGVGSPSIGRNWNAAERTLPRGVYYMRDRCLGSPRIRRVVVCE